MFLKGFMIFIGICIAILNIGMLAILIPSFLINKDVSYLSGILLGAFSCSMAVLWFAKMTLMLSLLASGELAAVSAVVYAVVALAMLIWNEKKAACS